MIPGCGQLRALCGGPGTHRLQVVESQATGCGRELESWKRGKWSFHYQNLRKMEELRNIGIFFVSMWIYVIQFGHQQEHGLSSRRKEFTQQKRLNSSPRKNCWVTVAGDRTIDYRCFFSSVINQQTHHLGARLWLCNDGDCYFMRKKWGNPSPATRISWLSWENNWEIVGKCRLLLGGSSHGSWLWVSSSPLK